MSLLGHIVERCTGSCAPICQALEVPLRRGSRALSLWAVRRRYSGVPSYAIAFPAADSHSRDRPGISGADSRNRTCIVADNSPMIAAALPTELCLHMAALHAVGQPGRRSSYGHTCKIHRPYPHLCTKRCLSQWTKFHGYSETQCRTVLSEKYFCDHRFGNPAAPFSATRGRQKERGRCAAIAIHPSPRDPAVFPLPPAP